MERYAAPIRKIPTLKPVSSRARIRKPVKAPVVRKKRFLRKNVDVSWKVLDKLFKFGYRRAQWVVERGGSHRKPDICDTLEKKYSGSQFIQLKSLVEHAPVFGSNPPAPIYGMSHPLCRCTLLIFPPKNSRDLVIPNKTFTKEEKAIIMSNLPPQSVMALSRVGQIEKIDYNRYLDSGVVNEYNDLKENKEEEENKDFFSNAWDFLKMDLGQNIFGSTRTANSRFVSGDVVKIIEDLEVESDLTIITPLLEGYLGVYLGDDPNDGISYFYCIDLGGIYPFLSDSAVKMENSDITDNDIGKKAVVADTEKSEYLEVVITRKFDDMYEVYDVETGGIVTYPVDSFNL
jgi:hypothetical protein